MKEKISKICLTAYAVFFILSAFLAAAPGGSVAFFCVMIALAIPPMIAGPKWYRILAIFALLIAITLAVFDYNAGKHRREDFIQQLNDTQKQQKEENRLSGK